MIRLFIDKVVEHVVDRPIGLTIDGVVIDYNLATLCRFDASLPGTTFEHSVSLPILKLSLIFSMS